MENILDFMLELGNKIYATFTNIVTWMQTKGVKIPLYGIFEEWEWISLFDVITTYGLTIILGAIITKWVVDMFRT